MLEYDPPRRLVHSWSSFYDPEMAAEEPSRVTWEIEPQDGGLSLLTVVHDQLEGAPKTAAGVAGPGWMMRAERPEDAARDRRAADDVLEERDPVGRAIPAPPDQASSAGSGLPGIRRSYSSSISGLESMKSAEARLQAIGTL